MLKKKTKNKKKHKGIAHKVFRILAWMALGFFILTLGLTLLYRFVPPPITPLMIIRMFEQSLNDEPVKLHKSWRKLENIGHALPRAVIASEDQKFYQHNGFDVEAIREAMEKNKEGKRLRGGSTISQQTAKNVFLWPGRSWIRKGLEVYFTILIETLWPKDRILEVYLNVIEMGNGVYGAQAASEYYFKKDAIKLSRNEAARIAAILPNPRKWNAAKPTSYISKREQWIVRQMNNLGKFPFEEKK